MLRCNREIMIANNNMSNARQKAFYISALKGKNFKKEKMLLWNIRISNIRIFSRIYFKNISSEWTKPGIHIRCG